MREPVADLVVSATGLVGHEMASRNRETFPRSGRYPASLARAHIDAPQLIPPSERGAIRDSQGARGLDPGPQGNPRRIAMDLVSSQALPVERSRRAPEKSAELCDGWDLEGVMYFSH